MKKIISILLVILMVFSLAPLVLADENETDAVPELISAEGEEEETEEEEVEEETEEEEVEEETEEEEVEEETEEEEVEEETEEEEVEEETEEEEIDEETEEEIEAMEDKSGAEVRLLQLQLSIERNIERGNDIIAKAQELGEDASDLETIIAEMEALSEEVAAADPAAEDAVEVFVDLKKDARDLSKDFRDKAREIIPADEANRLRERLKDKTTDDLEGMEENIRKKKQEFNARSLGALFKKMAIEDEELLEQIESGDITVKEAKDQIREQFKEMSPEERREAFAAAKETGVKRAVSARAKSDEAMTGFIERKEERVNQRLDKLSGKEGIKPETLEKYTGKRLEKIDQAKTRVNTRIENRQQVRAPAKQDRPNKAGGR